ncbi:MAG TPA: glycosyltransferase, partial [Caldilineaceae bacterium]|nr:glycosyltransferase [Caldilineaceae bacterium]
FGLHYHHHELDQGQADHSHTVERVTGAALAVHRRVIERVGLLDEGFWPGYFEDMDYCLRARAAGFQIYYCAEAVLCHQESSSRLDFESLQRFYHRGRLRFALKHLPPQQWLDEFIAAERNDGNRSTTPRQAAYYQALVDAPELVEAYWQADDSQVQQIMAALRGLINEGSRTAQPGEKTTLAPFSDFTFPATVPWVGGLLSGFRRLWYNVAARWPVQHLQAQQSVVNQQLLDQIDALRERIHVLERNNETLQQELDQVALATAGLVQELTLLKATL